MMPGDFFIGPIGPIEILTILLTMIVWILTALGIAVRRQVGDVIAETPQTRLGQALHWGPLVLLAISFAVQAGQKDFDLVALSRGPLALVLLVSLIVAYRLGVRWGRWTIGTQGIAHHSLQFWPWDDLAGYRFEGAAGEALKLSFPGGSLSVPTPSALRANVEAVLRRLHAPAQSP
ncbi:MAG: hypothetical protein K1X74_16925 [Pirellulales bacterium]|nr:hypothetical protein [Pirellulales bacterium]